jgi:hypothetical protein
VLNWHLHDDVPSCGAPPRTLGQHPASNREGRLLVQVSYAQILVPEHLAAASPRAPSCRSAQYGIHTPLVPAIRCRRQPLLRRRPGRGDDGGVGRQSEAAEDVLEGGRKFKGVPRPGDRAVRVDDSIGPAASRADSGRAGA